MGQAIQAAAHRFAVEVILAPVREPGEIEVLLRQLGAESGSGLIGQLRDRSSQTYS